MGRKKKKTGRNWRSLIVWTIILSVLAGLLGAAVKRKYQLRLDKVYVTIDSRFSKDQVITEADVIALMEANYGYALDQVILNDANLRRVEEQLQADPRIARSELYLDSNQQLHVYVRQRDPLVRVKGDTVDYYIGRDGRAIASADARPARVPIATGINEALPEGFPSNEKPSVLNDLYQMSLVTSQDTFFHALIEQFYVDDYGEIWIVPKVRGERLLIGDAQELEDRLLRIKAVYDQKMQALGSEQYAELHFKWKGQVTRVKR